MEENDIGSIYSGIRLPVSLHEESMSIASETGQNKSDYIRGALRLRNMIESKNKINNFLDSLSDRDRENLISELKERSIIKKA